MTSADASWALDRALSRGIAACMEQQGFAYPTPQLERPAPRAIDEFLGKRYGAPTERPDGTAGYSFDEEEGSTTTIVPPPTEEQQTEAYQRALYGGPAPSIPIYGVGGGQVGSVQVGADGCMGSSLIDLFGSLEAYAEYNQTQHTVETIAADSFVRLYTDPVAIEASKEWAACMSDQGFSEGTNGPYKTPLDPSNQDWPSPRPSGLESATATADLECRSKTEVDGRLAAVEAEWQTELLESQPDIVQRLASLYDFVRNSEG
jgi:hypothetical protein